jgi:hypothetical protein
MEFQAAVAHRLSFVGTQADFYVGHNKSMVDAGKEIRTELHVS